MNLNQRLIPMVRLRDKKLRISLSLIPGSPLYSCCNLEKVRAWTWNLPRADQDSRELQQRCRRSSKCRGRGRTRPNDDDSHDSREHCTIPRGTPYKQHSGIGSVRPGDLSVTAKGNKQWMIKLCISPSPSTVLHPFLCI
jgi:hypothetical protein